MRTEADLLRTVDAKRTPDALGVGVLPIRTVISGNLAIQRIAHSRLRHRERIKHDILQIVIARRRKIEIEDAFGVAFDRHGVAQMSLIPDVFVACKRALAAEARLAVQRRRQISLRIGGLVIIPDAQRVGRLHERRDVVGKPQIFRGLLRMGQGTGANDIRDAARPAPSANGSGGVCGTDTKNGAKGRVGQRLLITVKIVGGDKPG